MNSNCQDLGSGETISVALLADGTYQIVTTDSLKVESQRTVILSNRSTVWQIGIVVVYSPESPKCFSVFLDLPKLAEGAKSSAVQYFKTPSSFQGIGADPSGFTLRKSNGVVELSSRTGGGMLAVQASYEL